jgi:hypothetical protein
MAQVTLALLQRPERWIHRRVERVRFIDRQTVHRTVSVDFTLPAGIPPIGSFRGQDVYVAPLFLLGKEHPHPFRSQGGGLLNRMLIRLGELPGDPLPASLYSDVNLIDQTGARLPLITRRESARLASVILGEAARQSAGQHPIPDPLFKHILEIVTSDKHGRQVALDRVLKGSLDPYANVLRRLRKGNFPELAHMLARYSLIVNLFTHGPPGRCLRKLSYTEPLDGGRSKSPGRFRRSIGWKSEHLVVPVNEIGSGSSHHIEIDVPEDLQINAVDLAGMSYSLAGKPSSELMTHERDYSIHQVGKASSGSIYISEPTFPRRVGEVSVKMRVRRTGFLLSALVASLITTGVLGALALAAPAIVDANKSEGTVAALLLLPSLLAAYIVRPGEHVITSRMLRWVRFALVGNAALPFAAILFLLTTKESPHIPFDIEFLRSMFEMFIQSDDSSGQHLQKSWGILTAGSVLFSILFAISYIAPVPHGDSHYWLRPRSTSSAAQGTLHDSTLQPEPAQSADPGRPPS